MKLVVHLSTHDKSGGAAVAAWRLHQGLQRLGVDSRMVSRNRSWPGPDVSRIASECFEATDLFHLHRVKAAQPPGATFFSFTPTSIPLLEHPWIAAADVVHLHWVAKFLSPEDIEALCLAGKTVFWTFHDQWAHTGGCHYIGGTRRLQSDWDGTAQIDASLHELARMELERKKRIFGSLPIHVIAPSRWMAEEAAASGIFPREHIHVVPAGVDSAIYHPASTAAGEDDGVTLLFGCQNLNERRKGYQELREALQRCMEDPRFTNAVREGRIRMRTFGSPHAEDMDLPIPVTHLGTIREESAVAEILRTSSAFLCPTLDDNLPNVVMESLVCGSPVIAFDTGGVPDMVTHQVNGLLAPQGDVAALARHLTDFCLDAGFRQRLREGARAMDVSSWMLETAARRMLALYDAAGPAESAASPDAIAETTLEGRIHPHFATEMTRALIGLVHEQREDFKLRDYTLRRRYEDARRDVDIATGKLEKETATRKTTQERLWEAKDKLKTEASRIKECQASLKEEKRKSLALKQEIAALKQQLLKQRPFYVRVWRSLRKRLKNTKPSTG